jgi:hypothetical protein
MGNHGWGPVLEYLFAYFPDLLTLLIYGYACWRGGRTEQTVAASQMTLGFLLLLLEGPNPTGQDIGVVSVDVLSLLVLTFMAMSTRRLWLLCMAAFQLDVIACHIVKAVYPGISTYAYLMGLLIWGSYAQMACLAAGLLSDKSRKR